MWGDKGVGNVKTGCLTKKGLSSRTKHLLLDLVGFPWKTDESGARSPKQSGPFKGRNGRPQRAYIHTLNLGHGNPGPKCIHPPWTYASGLEAVLKSLREGVYKVLVAGGFKTYTTHAPLLKNALQSKREEGGRTSPQNRCRFLEKHGCVHLLQGKKTYEHKQVCRIVRDWVGGKMLFLFFFCSGHSLWGRKTHPQNPPKILGQSREDCVYVSFLYVFFTPTKVRD